MWYLIILSENETYFDLLYSYQIFSVIDGPIKLYKDLIPLFAFFYIKDNLQSSE